MLGLHGAGGSRDGCGTGTSVICARTGVERGGSPVGKGLKRRHCKRVWDVGKGRVRAVELPHRGPGRGRFPVQLSISKRLFENGAEGPRLSSPPTAMPAPKVGSVEVGPPAQKGEGRARRCYISANQLVESPAEGVHVLADILERSARLFPQKNALGWRDLVRMIEEEKEVKKVVAGVESVEKKKWSYFELSDYKYWTYAEFAAIVKKVGSALVETGHTKDTIFNIYSGTSPRWQVMANGASPVPPAWPR